MAIGDRNRAEMLTRVATSPRARWGWGPSDLASQEEKDAWQAMRVGRAIESGQASVADLPEAYGGRPQGTTRRAIRQQLAWDAQQTAEIERQKFVRDAARFDIELSREQRLRDQEDRELITRKTLNDRENKIQEEARFIQDSIIGGQQIGVDENGNPKFSEPINVRDPNSVERLQRLAKNHLGMENKAAYDMWKTLYDDALKYREEAEADMAESADKNLSFIVKQQEEASSLGVDTSKFFVQDKTTGEIKNVDQIGIAKAIGEARRTDIENKKKEVSASKIDEEAKKQASSIISQIEDTDKLIREANFKAQRETSEKLRDEYLNNADFYRSERELLAQRFANLVPQAVQEQPQSPQAPAQNRPAEGSGFQDTLEKLNRANDKLGQDYLNGVKRLGIDNVSDNTIKELLDVTGLKNKNELVSALKDQSALDWANANPDDPRSQKIKVKLGVQ